ncbi:hypothetical protein AgCh_006475 [Apium graveolens]
MHLEPAETRYDAVVMFSNLHVLTGEWRSWDIAETVKIYNESFPDDAFSMDGFGGNDDGDEAKSSRDDVPEDK